MKILKILGAIFSLIGLAIIIFGINIIIANNEFMKTAELTEGIITDIESYRDSDGDRHYIVYVQYEVEGRSYEDSSRFYSSNMRKGDDIKVYYNPERPSDFKVTGETTFNTIFPIAFGGIFFIIGMCIMLPPIIKTKMQNKVKQYGELINAEIDDIDINYSMSVNGRHPYVIVCSWKDPNSGELYQFRSNNLWFDPEKLLEGRKTLEVYVDMQKPKKYYVDTSQIEALVKN